MPIYDQNLSGKVFKFLAYFSSPYLILNPLYRQEHNKMLANDYIEIIWTFCHKRSHHLTLSRDFNKFDLLPHIWLVAAVIVRASVRRANRQNLCFPAMKYSNGFPCGVALRWGLRVLRLSTSFCLPHTVQLSLCAFQLQSCSEFWVGIIELWWKPRVE